MHRLKQQQNMHLKNVRKDVCIESGLQIFIVKFKEINLLSGEN